MTVFSGFRLSVVHPKAEAVGVTKGHGYGVNFAKGNDI